MVAMGKDFDPEQIPNEEARLGADGSLEIFVRLPGGGELNLIIPSGHWRPKEH